MTIIEKAQEHCDRVAIFTEAMHLLEALGYAKKQLPTETTAANTKRIVVLQWTSSHVELQAMRKQTSWKNTTISVNTRKNVDYNN